MNLRNQLRASVNNSNNVLDVTASEEIIMASAVKCFQFRREEIRCGDNSHLRGANIGPLRICQRGLIPAVSETKDGGIGRHYIHNEAVDTPSADDIFFRTLAETERAETSFHLSVG